MALSGSILAEAITSAIIDPRAGAETRAQVKALWKKISDEIVDHITKNAVVTVNAGIAVSTTGTEFAQSGATTSTGSGTVA
jgi:hypothetical protein